VSIEEFVSNYGNIITLSVLVGVYVSAFVYTLTQKGEPKTPKQENFDNLRYMHNKTYFLDDFMFR
tara:strand:+ start:678 stop:872 length:195 start_codon:yes stop_codon:yes gene_type:complete